MTGNLEDQLLRDVLAHEAARHDGSGYDPAEVVAGALARRRRRRAVVGGAALALTVVVGSAVFVAAGARSAVTPAREIVPQDPPSSSVPEGSSVSAPLVRVPGGRNASALSIPFCEAQIGGDVRSDVLHVDGTAYDTDCAYARPHHRYLWYHAGRTVMSSPDGLEVLVGDRLVMLSRLMSPGVRISMDGRYLAWFEKDALFVHDLVSGRPAGRFTMPDEVLSAGILGGRGHGLERPHLRPGPTVPSGCTTSAGTGGRRSAVSPRTGVLVTGRSSPTSLLRASRSSPRSSRRTSRGLARSRAESPRTARSSRCGRCPSAGRCGPRTGSHAVQLGDEGFTAHPAEDLGTQVLLDVPVDPADVPAVAWDAQWESGSTVLVTWAVTHGPDGFVTVDDFVTSRCSATTGDCQVLPRDIHMPLSALAHPGG